MPGPMNTQNAGWQNCTPTAVPQYMQNGMGQNGGYVAVSQQPDIPFSGRFINQIEEVMPKEVPMDGRIAIFPTQSLDMIYIKAWDKFGSIKTFRYVLDPTQNLNAPPQPQEPDMQSQILERLEQLEKQLGEAQSKNPSQRNNSKGGEK